MTMQEHTKSEILEQAGDVLSASRSILITAGAGMGVDSGLPDFRGPEVFWRAYPPIKELGLNFSQMSTPRCFSEDPPLAGGFFGHRLGLYRAAVPHRGYEVLRDWTAKKSHFVFTTNVDGPFKRTGYESDGICEAHGTIHHLQCIDNTGHMDVWPVGTIAVEIDESTKRATGELPLSALWWHRTAQYCDVW